MIKTREFHELASLFPMLPENEINLLAQDIKTNGLMYPITLYGDKILDGRNRYKACELSNVEPFYTEYTGNDPLQYVISLNLSRRHLNESQRAVVAEKIAIILKNDDPELKSKASTERWDRERELKEINDNTQLTWDQKQAMSGHLKSTWSKRAILESKAGSRKLYVAKSGDRIKVGVSSFPESRIDYLRCADPSIELLKVFSGSFREEKLIHKALENFNIDREWFRYCEESMAIIEKEMQTANLQPEPITAHYAAKLMNVGERNIRSVREIKEKAPERIAEIESGEVTIHNVLKDIKDTEKRKEISERFSVTEMPNGLFDVIYCDPPWQYEYSESLSRSIEMHYPSMTLGDIKNMNVPAEKDSVLLMWATAPKLEEALSVLNAWGFKYRTNSVWDKQIIGIGYWFRGQHELLLVGVKGNFSPPMQEDRVSSFYSEKRTEHSKKPDYYYDMIEKCFPARKYLELFSRKKHNDKWTTWGSENE